MCYQQPPIVLIVPHLFYTNKLVQKHNKNVFTNTSSCTFIFRGMDINHPSCLPSYKVSNDWSKIIGLHFTTHIREEMLIESCVDNYATFDGLVNEAYDIFKTSTYNNKTIIWIMFQNFKIKILPKNITHYYNDNIESKWHQLNLFTKDIKVVNTQSFAMLKIQFLVQLALRITIHHSQGLSLNELVFDARNVNKHGLIYTTLYHIWTKEKLYLWIFLQHQFFCVDPKVI